MMVLGGDVRCTFDCPAPDVRFFPPPPPVVFVVPVLCLCAGRWVCAPAVLPPRPVLGGIVICFVARLAGCGSMRGSRVMFLTDR